MNETEPYIHPQEVPTGSAREIKKGERGQTYDPLIGCIVAASVRRSSVVLSHRGPLATEETISDHKRLIGKSKLVIYSLDKKSHKKNRLPGTWEDYQKKVDEVIDGLEGSVKDVEKRHYEYASMVSVDCTGEKPRVIDEPLNKSFSRR